MRHPAPALPTRLGFAVLLAAALAACAPTRPAPDAAPPERGGVEAVPSAEHALVLVSIDGFRWDYLDRGDVAAPTLRRLVAEGVRAERLVPVYPSKTFPNHYSLVTGLHPEDHGIVNNTMHDAAVPDSAGGAGRFSLSDRAAIADVRWWGGEPIWVTAERQGVRAGTVFWPGSEAAIGGVRPSDWLVYDGDLPYAARVDSALVWTGRPAPRRDRFVTLYFEGVDTAGHRFGPDAPETAAAIEEVDAALARLVAGLEARGALDQTDLVIVSDHGMTALAPDRVVVLDDVADLETEVEEAVWGQTAGVWPAAGVDVDELVARIDAVPHVRATRREATPERFRYRASRRIPPVVIVPDEGWTVSSREYVERYPDRPSGGGHGYDNELADMGALFVARGPSFARGVTVAPFSAVDVYDVLAEALGIRPAPNSGDPAVADRVLRAPAER
ncbi:ectonucleotide pyrophosphatase/phosphodiesterase [Rubrivirga sp. S365]|uniref:Ectonucleotide pyrophosphatase/phosphodiesterase n=1 Tax=Rubrivirga litoralis TaxID=3075598 RepID=A0ABU3BNW7_9BACT|nr:MULTISPECIES: ectonucleotide pyrophosphatase/phosphodiesterase [unclassified Rubrivirga]MDT0630989.1 ectonucleotide pyrophosphatase/phosphodiesterase [Rubrivirga sp. F394]MDT7858031.1 ectonucleotide pyrophosphatase/phosphodiesterase [Rubrivirga sp. S365]